MATIILKWSLPPPHPNEQSYLRFLELEIIPEEARAVLSVHGPSVSTLTLYHQPRFEIDSLFTNLEELVIANPVWSSPLPAFPRTLKHIKVITGPFMPLDHVIALVAQVVPTLPNLRVISVEARFAANKHYLDLQEACQTQGVEILVHSSSVHPYHIEMGRFPRQYTFSEFFDVGDCRL
ncbi:hypothetical protein EI94DRAFT_1745192 [Lactarius quietus]|nr:hypothetical protein EI94DRAFT_1745192 [Lactarius quietus]